MDDRTWNRRVVVLVLGVVMVGGATEASAGSGPSGKKRYRGMLGTHSNKVKTEGGKTYLWAGGRPGTPDAIWYDFTGSPIDASELQFGIGKDRIRAIDDPMFVKPDDPRLARLPGSPYRPTEKRASNDDIRVIGYVVNGQARAYPIALLDHHELVNDIVGGKPVTVGW